MCGILGYITTKPNTQKHAISKMRTLFIESEMRGRDATGYAYIKKNEIISNKANLCASDYVDTPVFKELEKKQPNVFIGHTRAMTKGSASINDNNHPLTSKHLALVHNGVITNDDALFELYNLPRIGEVDSEIILRLLQFSLVKKKKTITEAIKWVYSEIRGSATTAIIYTEKPDTLYLTASSNPLYLAYEKSTGIIYFASDDDYLTESLEERNTFFYIFKEITNKGDIIIEKAKDDTTIEISPSKISISEITRPSYVSNWQTFPKEDNKKPKQLKTIPDNQNFTWRTVIIKPSLFSTAQLEERLSTLEDIAENIPLNDREKSEKSRIENALMARYEKEDIEPIDEDDEIEALIDAHYKNQKLLN